ncbi:MAG: hypothetical protein NZM12_00410 [Steroidobacteraceae bacterium]|nr:hypothetical protein [Steroidobacteraceae bacterium]MDW8258246.1 hypothetical protein [Gammaproteobacteria bacterium]
MRYTPPVFWLTASYLGLPDAGLATYTDILSRVAKVVEKSSCPVIADADVGFTASRKRCAADRPMPRQGPT